MLKSDESSSMAQVSKSVGPMLNVEMECWKHVMVGLIK